MSQPTRNESPPPPECHIEMHTCGHRAEFEQCITLLEMTEWSDADVDECPCSPVITRHWTICNNCDQRRHSLRKKIKDFVVIKTEADLQRLGMRALREAQKNVLNA